MFLTLVCNALVFNLPEKVYPEKRPTVSSFLMVYFDSSVHSLFTLAATLFLPTSAEDTVPSQNVRGICRGSPLTIA